MNRKEKPSYCIHHDQTIKSRWIVQDYFQIAAHQDQESNAIDDHKEYDVSFANRISNFERQTDGKLSVIGNAN